MNLTALMPVRNEAWVLGYSARVALRWVDNLVILLHACIDGSERIATDLAKEFHPRVTLLHVDGEKWDEMAHRQMMLVAARDLKATHIAIVDADEVLTANLLDGGMREPTEGARGLPGFEGGFCSRTPQGSILQLPGYNLRNGLDRYHSNGIWSCRWFSLAFADNPRLHWRSDTFHHREPFIAGSAELLRPYRPIRHGAGGIMHLWGSNERRLRAKHRAYKITEALRWPNKDRAEIERMYSWAEKGTGPHDCPAVWTFDKVPGSWRYPDLEGYLDLDAVPWQEAWCDRMISEHGRERFAGLSV